METTVIFYTSEEKCSWSHFVLIRLHITVPVTKEKDITYVFRYISAYIRSFFNSNAHKFSCFNCFSTYTSLHASAVLPQGKLLSWNFSLAAANRVLHSQLFLFYSFVNNYTFLCVPCGQTKSDVKFFPCYDEEHSVH